MSMRDAAYLLAIITLAVLLLHKGCGSATTVDVSTEVIYDTIERVIIKEVPVVKEVISIKEVPHYITDTITLSSTDTITIVQQWLDSVSVYQETREDTSLQATITDTIYQNQIIGRSFAYKIMHPTIYKIHKPDRFQMIVSAQSALQFGYDGGYRSIMGGVDIGLKFRSGTYLSVGYLAGRDQMGTLRIGQVIKLKK